MTGALIGAAALGLAKAKGLAIPHFGSLGEAATLAIAGYALDKTGLYRARWLRHATTGFAAIAVYEMASSGSIPGFGAAATTPKTSGDDDIEGGYNVR